jgi:hypothetical protein
MAVPIQFAGADFVLWPRGDQEGASIPIPVRRRDDGVLLSCWLLSPEELEELPQTRRVWLQLGVADGPAMPAVTVAVRKQDLAQ